MQLKVINSGYFKLDGGAMFGVVPQSMWKKLNPPDANNMCSWAMRCLLVQDGGHIMLIDNGMGKKQSEKFFGYYFLHGEDSLEKSMQKADVSAKDITDMFLTHLHFDHCGGGIRQEGEKLVTTFANATYWSNEAHWEWAKVPNAREKASFLKENILPMKESEQLKWVSSSKFSENIDILFVDGHTEKMMLPLISYKGRKILYCADLFPSAGHIPLPYVMAYDTRPLLTLQEKERILKQAVAENWVLFFEHDPVNECCSLQQTETGIKAKDFFKLSEL
ncbi:MAG: MBL fold metallo-hydrolase [Cytophagales bacterium]|nr:MAG: MBL fold metallo-hydrolase [Cytophagales bacterium]